MSLVRSLCSDLRESGDGLLDLPTLLDPLVVRLARRGRITSRVLTTGGRIQIEGRRALLVAEICREALTNVIRHAHATDVVVRVMHRGTHFSMSVGDNGRGFPAAAIEGRGAFGVIGMRERAQALRGFLQILREDERTIVSVSAPLRSSDVLAP
jgi:signal transduction histidine kinase